MSPSATHLVWTEHNGRRSPQLLYAERGKPPFLDAGIKGCVVAWHHLSEEEGRLPLESAAKLYPEPPKLTG